MPKTDIVVPIYGGRQHLERLLPAIPPTTSNYAVWLSEDATPEERGGGEEFQVWLQEQAEKYGYYLELAPENGGFAATNNRVAFSGTGDYICLLNSDTVPHKGWLDRMVAVLESTDQIGIVGAKLIYPPWSDVIDRPAGKIQHAGVAFNTQRMPYHIFQTWSPDNPKVNRPLILKAVTGACLLVRRELYEQVGGLDEKFGQGNFEDIDLCLKVGELGYDVAYCPQAVLYHWGSGSNNVDDANINAAYFMYRWADKVESDDWLFY